MDFVNRLKPEHLQSFWYFASKVNFALIGTFGSLLWATSPNVQEAEFYKARLAEYRWTLGVSAKSADFMEFAVGVLDVGIGRVQQDQWRERHLKNHPDQANAHADGVVSLADGFGLGMVGSGGAGMSGTSSISTGSGITSPSAIPPAYVPPPLPHMSPPVTGDEMDQDDDGDEEEEEEEEHSFETSAAAFQVNNGSDHDMDMGFMEDSKFGNHNGHHGSSDKDNEGDSDESTSYSHPPQTIPPGYNPQHHQYQQHFQQYSPSRGWQDSGYSIRASTPSIK